MAARATAKRSTRKSAAPAKKSPAAKKPRTAAPDDAAQDTSALRAELEQAKKRIAELEKLNADVADRLEWVIDSLRDLINPRR